MIVFVLFTLFFVTACECKLSPSYRPACQAVVDRINQQELKNVFDMTSPEQLQVGSITFPFKVNSTSFTNWGKLWVADEIWDSERINANSHIIRFLMKNVPHVVSGKLWVKEEKDGKLLETLFQSSALNGSTWRIEVLVHNSWNVQEIKYFYWANYRTSQKYNTDFSCPLEKTTRYCYQFQELLNKRLTNMFQDKLKDAIEAVINKIKVTNLDEVEIIDYTLPVSMKAPCGE